MSKKTGKQREYSREERTRTLLTHFQEMNWHSDNAVSEYRQIETVEFRILLNNGFTDPDAYIRSITRSKQITQVLLTHVAMSIKRWAAKSKNTHDARLRRRIIKQRYLEPQRKTFTEISTDEGVKRYVIVKQHDIAIREIAHLIYGADALEDKLGDMETEIAYLVVGAEPLDNKYDYKETHNGAVRDSALECQ